MKKKKKKFACPEGFYKGEKQVELREKYSLTIGNLAEDMDAPNSSAVLWRYENKKDVSPNLYIVAKIVDVFKKYGENISVSDMYDTTKIIYSN